MKEGDAKDSGWSAWSFIPGCFLYDFSLLDVLFKTNKTNSLYLVSPCLVPPIGLLITVAVMVAGRVAVSLPIRVVVAIALLGMSRRKGHNHLDEVVFHLSEPAKLRKGMSEYHLSAYLHSKSQNGL